MRPGSTVTSPRSTRSASDANRASVSDVDDPAVVDLEHLVLEHLGGPAGEQPPGGQEHPASFACRWVDDWPRAGVDLTLSPRVC